MGSGIRQYADVMDDKEAALVDNSEFCGSEPQFGGPWGDCWCTLDPQHKGPCFCEPCTARYGAPGWDPRLGVDECWNCGRKLIWQGLRGWDQHTEEHHARLRTVWLGIVRELLQRELAFRAAALDAMFSGRVLVVWRVKLPTGYDYGYTQIPYEVWDTVNHELLLAVLGYGIRDLGPAQYGVRPHFMHVKHRVFDERLRGIEDAAPRPS